MTSLVRISFADHLSLCLAKPTKSDRENCKRFGETTDVQFAKNLPLPVLAALLEHAIFVGHDSGISHLAAAAGAKCILLFGPTESGYLGADE